MREFFQHSLTRSKLRSLYMKSVVGNFVGFLAGSVVTVLSSYHSVERRALKNLFGILPRQKVTVHLLPEWLEWALSVLVGFLVMEFTRYLFNRQKYLAEAHAALAADKAAAESGDRS
ncbi:MAG: hypothetical protein WDO12_10260 [Pseudomonadota bacterium]